MKRVKALSVLALALAGCLAAVSASAQHRGHGGHYSGSRVHFGVVLGVPAYGYGYGYYPRPYYYPPYGYYPYYPPVTVAPAEPPVYIERGDAPAASEAAQDSWYFCPEANAYYPYVKQCAKGWQRVAPRPQG